MLIIQSPQQFKISVGKDRMVAVDAMWLYLAPFPPSPLLCDTIIELGFVLSLSLL